MKKMKLLADAQFHKAFFFFLRTPLKSLSSYTCTRVAVTLPKISDLYENLRVHRYNFKQKIFTGCPKKVFNTFFALMWSNTKGCRLSGSVTKAFSPPPSRLSGHRNFFPYITMFFSLSGTPVQPPPPSWLPGY